MRNIKSIVALLLALAMAFALVACNKGPEVETFEGDFTWKDSVSTLATNWNPHTY